jgi:hypothetical protein
VAAATCSYGRRTENMIHKKITKFINVVNYDDGNKKGGRKAGEPSTFGAF